MQVGGTKANLELRLKNWLLLTVAGQALQEKGQPNKTRKGLAVADLDGGIVC
jgi:hypothetical protein